MELRKTSESVRNTYENGVQNGSVVESVQYNVLDSEGNVVGNATVWQSSASVNFSLSGFSGIEAGETAIKAALGIAAEETAE